MKMAIAGRPGYTASRSVTAFTGMVTGVMPFEKGPMVYFRDEPAP
jgi:hypothetical protein